MRSKAAELVMNGLDCSIDGRLRKGGVCAISQWVFAKHHDSKTIPSPLRSTPHGRQPSGHNPGAVRSRFADTRLCGVDCSVLRAGHRTFSSSSYYIIHKNIRNRDQNIKILLLLGAVLIILI